MKQSFGQASYTEQFNRFIRDYLTVKSRSGAIPNIRDVYSSFKSYVQKQKDISIEWQAELGENWKEIRANYLHTIGNLTLTGYNPELSDHSFLEKRDMKNGFADSPLHLNRMLAKLEHWNETEIKNRAESLADIAVKLGTGFLKGDR